MESKLASCGEIYLEIKQIPEKRAKLDKIIKYGGEVGVKAHRLYGSILKEQLKEIDSSIERGEQPKITVFRKYNEKRDIEEINVVLEGKSHVEDLTYFKIHPSQWNAERLGYSILSPKQAERFIHVIFRVLPEEKNGKKKVKWLKTYEWRALPSLEFLKSQKVEIAFWKISKDICE